MEWDYLEVNMMLQLGRKHRSHRSMKGFSEKMSGYGVTLHILCGAGVKLLIRSMCLLSQSFARSH